MKIELYTWSYCPFCVRAKSLLDGTGLPYEEHVMDTRSADLEEVKKRYNHGTVPIVVVDDKFIGGFTELETLEREGGLKA